MSTLPFFYTTAPESGTITLPEELRGKPLKIVVEEKPIVSKRSTMREFVEKYTGILKDCGIESVEALKEERINDMIERHR
jgi:hypothetical protein